MYDEDQMLQLSGIQHFAFCRRQWALIHVEQQWSENDRTVSGELAHERAHNEEFTERRKGLMITRGMRICSASLGITGQCDVVEFHQSEDGISLHKCKGNWIPIPIEYKRGKSKDGDEDRLQLCAQAMCLEEMLLCDIPMGYLFYKQTNSREQVELTKELRQTVRDMLEEMHAYANRGYTPKVKPRKGCRACSMNEICVPKLNKSGSVHAYLQQHLEQNI